MPTKIITKNGSGAPDAADLEQGELAVDLTNKRLYTEDAGGSVIEVGTSPSTIDINAGSIDGVTLGTNSAVTSAVITTADINGGTIDNTVIGGSTPAAGSFTTGQFGTSLNVDGTVTADGLTVSGDSLFVVSASGSPATQLFLRNGSTTAGAAAVLEFAANTTSGTAVGTSEISGYRETGGTSYLTFATSNGAAITEAMRIDSSGRLLVGTTDANPTLTSDNGIAIQNDGRIFGHVGDWALSRSGDGAFINFFESTGGTRSSVLGSIGISGGGLGISFDGGSNYLDDYEEGTWSLSVEGSGNVTSISGSDFDYVKIGQMVMLTGKISFSVTSTGVRTFVNIELPFGAEDDNTVMSGGGLIEGPNPFLGIAGGWATSTFANNTDAYFSFIPFATGSHVHSFSIMYKSA